MKFIKECHLLFSFLPGEIRVMEFRVAAIFLKVSRDTIALGNFFRKEKLQRLKRIQRALHVLCTALNFIWKNVRL